MIDLIRDAEKSGLEDVVKILAAEQEMLLGYIAQEHYNKTGFKDWSHSYTYAASVLTKEPLTEYPYILGIDKNANLNNLKLKHFLPAFQKYNAKAVVQAFVNFERKNCKHKAKRTWARSLIKEMQGSKVCLACNSLTKELTCTCGEQTIELLSDIVIPPTPSDVGLDTKENIIVLDIDKAREKRRSIKDDDKEASNKH